MILTVIFDKGYRKTHKLIRSPNKIASNYPIFSWKNLDIVNITYDYCTTSEKISKSIQQNLLNRLQMIIIIIGNFKKKLHNTEYRGKYQKNHYWILSIYFINKNL